MCNPEKHEHCIWVAVPMSDTTGTWDTRWTQLHTYSRPFFIFQVLKNNGHGGDTVGTQAALFFFLIDNKTFI